MIYMVVYMMEFYIKLKISIQTYKAEVYDLMRVDILNG